MRPRREPGSGRSGRSRNAGRRRRRDGILEQQRTSGPRNHSCAGISKPTLFRVSTEGGSFPRIRFFKITFWREPWICRSAGQRSREFHDAVIEKRRAHFDGVGHADAVHFGENIVGKEIFLIEPQISRQDRRRRPPDPAAWPPARPAAGREPGRDFSASEKVPFQYTWARSGVMRQPSRNRFTLYSKLIFSSETGHPRRAACPKWSAALGKRRTVRASKLARWVR